MSYRRMGIDEIRDIEHGTIVDTTEIDGDIKCFYCQEIIEQDGVAGKGSWMFHNECYHKHADSINGYFEQEEKKFRCVYGCGTEMEYDEYPKGNIEEINLIRVEITELTDMLKYFEEIIKKGD